MVFLIFFEKKLFIRVIDGRFPKKSLTFSLNPPSERIQRRSDKMCLEMEREKNFMTEGWKEKKRTEISRRLDMGSCRSSYVRKFYFQGFDIMTAAAKEVEG